MHLLRVAMAGVIRIARSTYLCRLLTFGSRCIRARMDERLHLVRTVISSFTAMIALLTRGWTRGVAASYGVFLAYYLENDYFGGATPLDYAFIGGLEFGACMLISPACTILTREFGRPAVMTAGVFVMAGGFIAASFAIQIWQLYLTQGVLVGLGMGAIFIPAIAVLPQWFLKRRSLAQGLASCGSGFGGLAFSLGTSAMIEQLSLAWALRIVSAYIRTCDVKHC